MIYWKNFLATTTPEFMQFIDRYYEGAPVGRGWGAYPDQHCVECGCKWEVVKPVGTLGRTCPQCGDHLPHFKWLGPEAEFNCDGTWLEPVGWKFFKLNSQN